MFRLGWAVRTLVRSAELYGVRLGCGQGDGTPPCWDEYAEARDAVEALLRRTEPKP